MKKYRSPITFLSLGLLLVLALPLKQEDPKPITLSEFNKRTSEKNKIILVYFHADWCMVCTKMQPLMQRVDSLYKSRLEILSIDTERDKEITKEFEIDALPILMLYKNGMREWIHAGILSDKNLTDKLNMYVTLPNN